MVTIRIKTNSGHVQDMVFAALLAIDGKPYEPVDQLAAVLERIAHVEGRVSAIETIFTRIEEEPPAADDSGPGPSDETEPAGG